MVASILKPNTSKNFLLKKLKRDLTNMKNEKNNYFIYLNLHSILNNQTYSINPEKVNLESFPNEFVNQIVKLLFSTQQSNPPTKPNPIILNQDNENTRFNYDTTIISHNFKTLFKILSFIAFILVCFSFICIVGVVFCIISYNFTYKLKNDDVNFNESDEVSEAEVTNESQSLFSCDQLDEESMNSFNLGENYTKGINNNSNRQIEDVESNEEIIGLNEISEFFPKRKFTKYKKLME
ncbi:unnamed protein product [Brachionus calyciflorus]|uniref:Uncharacterized protein n=1 Tax=Brachionus calyciflorus TaxID=104777 RepID=A0A813MBF8_9BILA|nr:unnamed protein product [Brachionus calyciflorus]